MASLGLPGLAGFWGEFPAHPGRRTSPAEGLSAPLFRVYLVVGALGTVFAAGYLLWLLQRTAFGMPKEELAGEHFHDVEAPEWIAWLPLLLLIVVIGFFPNIIFHVTDTAVQSALSGVQTLSTAATVNLSLAFTAPHVDYHALAPEIILASTLIVVLLVDLASERNRALLGTIAGIGLLASMIPILTLAVDGTDRFVMSGSPGYVVDNFALMMKALVHRRRLHRRAAVDELRRPKATTARASTTSCCSRRFSAWSSWRRAAT